MKATIDEENKKYLLLFICPKKKKTPRTSQDMLQFPSWSFFHKSLSLNGAPFFLKSHFVYEVDFFLKID